jgi:hypothetical protein
MPFGASAPSLGRSANFRDQIHKIRPSQQFVAIDQGHQVPPLFHTRHDI